MKTCIICDNSVENYTCLNSIFYCIKCYKQALEEAYLDKFSDHINELETKIETKMATLSVNNKIEGKYYFSNALHGRPFELIGDEKLFFRWDGHLLKMKNEENIIKYLQSKAYDLAAKNASFSIEISSSKVNVIKYENKHYYLNPTAIFSYFFAANIPNSMQKLSRNKKYFYLFNDIIQKYSGSGKYQRGECLFDIGDSYMRYTYHETNPTMIIYPRVLINKKISNFL